MSEPICDSARTSNDLPGNSIAINALPSLNYRIIALILAFWSGPAVAVNFGPPGRVLATLRGWG